ncbi:hypothetical protein [Streptomyces sp. NPDC002133]|uniref:hypothetical protein n=1 Tax=Streptomyces sp. NPDC002133 TaxID=3154409 RepID=UPI00331E33D0
MSSRLSAWGSPCGPRWLTGYRRLNHRYERHPANYLAFLGLAAAICCYKRFRNLTMQDTVLANMPNEMAC